MKHGIILSLVVSLSATAGLAAAADADTDDSKVLPGNMCQPQDSATYWRGRVFNRSTTTDTWVGCPVVRDITNATTNRITAAWIRALNPVANQQTMGCGLWAHNTLADGWTGNLVTLSVAPSDSYQTRSFSPLPLLAFDQQGMYDIECYLPRKGNANATASELIAYGYTERTN